MAFVTILSFFSMYLLLLGWSIYEVADGVVVKSMLWSGSEFWNDPIYGDEKRSLAIVGWLLLGTYLSGVQYIYRRFSTIDLTPGNFFSIGTHMVMTPVISLMLSYLITAVTPIQATSDTILIVAFLTGLFPERGFRLLLDKASSIFPSKEKKEADNLPLEVVEDISYMHRLRLNEVGIDNVKNLAQFNFLLLIIKTTFPARILLDWIAQTKLLLELSKHTDQLDKVDIRSALDFVEALEDNEDGLGQIVAITNLEPMMLEINFKNLKNDKSLWLLDHFKTNIEHVSLK